MFEKNPSTPAFSDDQVIEALEHALGDWVPADGDGYLIRDNYGDWAQECLQWHLATLRTAQAEDLHPASAARSRCAAEA